MLMYIIPAWLVATVIGCAIVGTSNKHKIRKTNCRKLLKKYKKIDEAYNNSMF